MKALVAGFFAWLGFWILVRPLFGATSSSFISLGTICSSMTLRLLGCVCVCGRWLCQIRVMCFPPFRICVLMCYFCFKFVITMVVSPPSDFICVSHPLEFVLAGVMDDLWFIGFLVSIDWRIPSIVEELFK